MAALLWYGVWEYRGHQRLLRSIPIRIHVNGSRGKSSVTRLITAGLRAGGIRTMGKTTGTLPRIIDPAGNEIAIKRTGRPNVLEQVKIVRYFEKYYPRAIVVECMAILPELQWFCEHRLVKSQIGVITNCRLDHTNEMGRFREQISRSLGNTIPIGGTLYTSEKTNFHVLKELAEKAHATIHRVGGGGVNVEEMRRFGHIEHPANVGLALAVCEHFGVERKMALKGMYEAIPDAGALRVALCQKDGKELLFVNAMAANDPESTYQVWLQIKELYAQLGTVIIMLNSRVDRQDRSIQLVEMMASNLEFDKAVLTGETPKKFAASLIRHQVPQSKIVALGFQKPELVYDKLFELVESKGTVLAIGNVGAGGLDIFRYFYKNRRIGG